MAWGIQFQTYIFIPRDSISRVEEAREKIKQLENEIQESEMRLAIMTASPPVAFIPENYRENSVYFLQNQVLAQTRILQQKCVELFQFTLLLEYLESNPEIDPISLNC